VESQWRQNFEGYRTLSSTPNMISRTARRFETTLLSSRQALPRPARLSTTSRKTSAQTTATAHGAPPDLPPFIPQSPANATSSNLSEDMTQFLHKRAPLTIIPSPIPVNSKKVDVDRWYTDSKSLDMTGIIDACLHNLHDVSRARDVFERLRNQVGSTLLETRLYNAFLEAYIGMAKKNKKERKFWILEAWNLYGTMEAGQEDVSPNARTYSLMLYLWYQ